MDGHDVEALCKAFHDASSTIGKPTCIVAKTFKGKGCPSEYPIHSLLQFSLFSRFNSKLDSKLVKKWCGARVFIAECLLGRLVLTLSARSACAGSCPLGRRVLALSARSACAGIIC